MVTLSSAFSGLSQEIPQLLSEGLYPLTVLAPVHHLRQCLTLGRNAALHGLSRHLRVKFPLLQVFIEHWSAFAEARRVHFFGLMQFAYNKINPKLEVVES
jgi:hypothetical protein